MSRYNSAQHRWLWRNDPLYKQIHMMNSQRLRLKRTLVRLERQHREAEARLIELSHQILAVQEERQREQMRRVQGGQTLCAAERA